MLCAAAAWHLCTCLARHTADSNEQHIYLQGSSVRVTAEPVVDCGEVAAVLQTAAAVVLSACVQFVREFAKLGLTRSVGGVLALALARELTPVVTAIILAGRVGSAFAAELGTMQVGAMHRGSNIKITMVHCCNTDPGAGTSTETCFLAGLNAACNVRRARLLCFCAALCWAS
jgi:hypothetical protein